MSKDLSEDHVQGASVKITENTTNDTLELELEGTEHSVSSNQLITFRIEGAHELIMTLKEIFQIKIGPLVPTKWKHHDVPIVTDDKIDDLDNTDLQGPPTLADVTAAYDGIHLGLQKYEYVSFPRPIGRFPSSHNIWYHQYSNTGITHHSHCQNLSNETLDEIQFREQCTKWIKTNVEYLMGLTGEQLALWKVHYKLGLQQHIDDRVFFAQIADQKAQVTRWRDMYQLEQAKYDRKKQIYKRMELINNAADARELHFLMDFI